MAAYPVTWSSDIKSNELPDLESLLNSSTLFYFGELEPKFVSGTVNVFKMTAVSGHVTTLQ